ncbi:MAG: extracellular solute-binding protein, partial [Actinobacteria bacterium]|nr:extracellular solute-binding protein [Actinomycetota bacterium]
MRNITELRQVSWATAPRWITQPQNFSDAVTQGVEFELRGRAADLVPQVFSNVKGLNWDIAVLPKGFSSSKGGELALEGWGVSAKSKNPAAAYKVAAFLVSPEVLTSQWTNIRNPVSRISVANAALDVAKAKRPSPQNIEALFGGVSTGMTLPRDIPFIKVTQEV